MPIRGSALKSSNTSVFEVQLKAFDGAEFSGILHHPASGYFWKFDSTLRYINLLESFFDSMDFPQATSKLRGFGKKSGDATKEMSELEKNAVHGAGSVKPTFIVRVQYRQNATWQGTIQWVEQKKTQQFRSVLELIKLMEEAVDVAGPELAGENGTWSGQ